MSTFVIDHAFVNVSPCRPRPCVQLRTGQLHIGESRDSGFALCAPRNDGRARHLTCPTLANSALVSWPPRKTRRPPISGSTASTNRPVEVLPVASLTQPIRYGPPNPARLPIELIRAIAPAAAVPESQAVGSVQNTPKVQKVPIAATVNAIIVT